MKASKWWLNLPCHRTSIPWIKFHTAKKPTKLLGSLNTQDYPIPQLCSLSRLCTAQLQRTARSYNHRLSVYLLWQSSGKHSYLLGENGSFSDFLQKWSFRIVTGLDMLPWSQSKLDCLKFLHHRTYFCTSFHNGCPTAPRSPGITPCTLIKMSRRRGPWFFPLIHSERWTWGVLDTAWRTLWLSGHHQAKEHEGSAVLTSTADSCVFCTQPCLQREHRDFEPRTTQNLSGVDVWGSLFEMDRLFLILRKLFGSKLKKFYLYHRTLCPWFSSHHFEQE